MTQESVYFLENAIPINGTLTYSNGTTITDGLVAIEVDNPNNYSLAIRTVSTGNGTIPEGIINVESVFLSNMFGDPVNSTRPDILSFFNVTIRNIGIQNKNFLVSVNIFDQNSYPISLACLSGLIPAGTVTSWISSWSVPLWATGGTATIYASVLTNFPRYNGTPYSAEKSSQFLITGAGGFVNPLIEQPSYNGTFGIAFRIPLKTGIGNFTVHSSTNYEGETITTETEFTAKLAGDVNNDGKVNYIDLNTLAIAYGSRLGQPAYNAAADFDSDGRVNYMDLFVLAGNYGKKAG